MINNHMIEKPMNKHKIIIIKSYAKQSCWYYYSYHYYLDLASDFLELRTRHLAQLVLDRILWNLHTHTRTHTDTHTTTTATIITTTITFIIIITTAITTTTTTTTTTITATITITTTTITTNNDCNNINNEQ